MKTIAGFPCFEVEFDKKGKADSAARRRRRCSTRSPSGRSRILRAEPRLEQRHGRRRATLYTEHAP
jgi:hypothetical protein